MYRSLGLDKTVERHLSLKRRGWSETSIIEAMLALQIAGGECLDDIDDFSADAGTALLSDNGMPSAFAFGRFLHRFDTGMSYPRELGKAVVPEENAMLQGLNEMHKKVVKQVMSHTDQRWITLDVDATVIQSEKRSCLGTYKGGTGYQPIQAIWAEKHIVVAEEFRDGNVPANFRALEFLKKCIGNLPEGTQFSLRSDGAWYQWEVMKYLPDWSKSVIHHISILRQEVFVRYIFSRLFLALFPIILLVGWSSSALAYISAKKQIEKWLKWPTGPTWGKYVWQEVEFPTGEAPTIMPGVTIDDNGMLFVSYGDNIYSYENDRWTQIDIPDQYVSDLSSSSIPSENAVRLIQHEKSRRLYGIVRNGSRNRNELLSYENGSWQSYPFPPAYDKIMMHVFDTNNIWLIAVTCSLRDGGGGCHEYEDVLLVHFNGERFDTSESIYERPDWLSALGYLKHSQEDPFHSIMPSYYSPDNIFARHDFYNKEGSLYSNRHLLINGASSAYAVPSYDIEYWVENADGETYSPENMQSTSFWIFDGDKWQQRFILGLCRGNCNIKDLGCWDCSAFESSRVYIVNSKRRGAQLMVASDEGVEIEGVCREYDAADNILSDILFLDESTQIVGIDALNENGSIGASRIARRKNGECSTEHLLGDQRILRLFNTDGQTWVLTFQFETGGSYKYRLLKRMFFPTSSRISR